ncbi:ATP-binding protein [Ekhidna sp.]|uniref:ATP-binding protein n=1 Tax=Ekhidna sp. TaxID=2608089 RepID=UPI003CCBFD11
MKSVFRKINHAGLEGISDPLEYRRVLFVNNLAIATFLVAISVTILIIFEGLYPQYVVTGLGGVSFLLALILNHRKQYLAARFTYVFLSVSILIAASFVAFRQGRFNETENILIGFMAVIYLLFDGRWRYIGYLSIYLLLMWLKFVKHDFQGLPYNLDFYLGLQNTSILCLLLFLFADSFRSSLMKAFVRMKTKDEIMYSMIDNVPLFIALIDKDFRYKMVNLNYEKAFGMARDKIIGSRVEEVLPANILNTHLPMVKAALNGASPEFLEKTDMPDGSSFYAGGKYVPIKSNEGKILGATVFVNDVSKLETAKIKLKEANDTKDRLFSIVAHDIRGPLDLFEGLINVSKDGVITNEEFLEHQEKVKEKLSALRETVNTLLEWARSQLDGINANPSKVNVNQVIESNVSLYKELVHKKKIKLKVDVPKDLDAWIDENHFKISVRNLLHNALKFTPKDGEVSTLVRKNDDKITMSIKDTGVGMDLKKINSIMKKELQNSRSGTGGELGTGLGLSLSLGLLEKNNCTVSISSEPNNGTEIKILIPYRLQKN